MVSTTELLDALRRFSLLEAEQLDELERTFLGREIEPRAVAEQLVEKHWLTGYQAERLLDGRGQELILGPYVVLDCLGKGGMGEVARARHRILGRIDALKTIRSDVLHSDAVVQRFQREARAAAQLQHPNVVRIHGADKAGDVHYLAMEYVAGTDLSKLVGQRGPLPVAVACEYIRQAALGLQHIHEAGLVHRDIKPSNLLYHAATGTGAVIKVLDLGLARFEAAMQDDGVGRLTASGAVMGTPDFLAPEQAVDAHSVDLRADLYSLGCTLYFLLTGQVPFPGGSLPHKLVAHQMHEPEALARLRPDTPPELSAVVGKLMAKNPADRFQTAVELTATLSRMGQLELCPSPLPVPQSTRSAVPPTRTGVSIGQPRSVATTPFIAPPLLPAAPPQRRSWLARRSRWWMVLAVLLLSALPIGGCLLSVWMQYQVVTSPYRRPSTAKTGPAPTPPDSEVAAGLPKRLEIDLGGGVKLEMVRIDLGEFWMGSADEEIEAILKQYKDAKREWFDPERPRHKVKITRPFYLGKYEVTQEQYEQVMGKDKNHSWFRATGNGKAKVEGKDTRQFPVESVSWEEADAFCDELMKQVGEKLPAELRRRGYKFHLPTEAQWEYACRAGTETAYHFGDELNGDKANCDGTHPFGTGEKGPYLERTCKVGGDRGEYPANKWGLYDMHGNVGEWCQDYFDEKFYAEENKKDPVNLKKDAGDRRVLRGGSWFNVARHCRAAYRFRDGAWSRHSDVGLRAALRLD
jgi:formylglycine-generating enzyme required for sulfatase activity/serine/threonine protein kinase